MNIYNIQYIYIHIFTKIDTDIAIEIETKYPETAQEEREKIKRKYENVERKLEVKRRKRNG